MRYGAGLDGTRVRLAGMTSSTSKAGMILPLATVVAGPRRSVRWNSLKACLWKRNIITAWCSMRRVRILSTKEWQG